MKTVNHKKGLLHIETPLGIVNIRVGLRTLEGRACDSIEVIPDQEQGFETVRVFWPTMVGGEAPTSSYGNLRLIAIENRPKEEKLS